MPDDEAFLRVWSGGRGRASGARRTA